VAALAGPGGLPGLPTARGRGAARGRAVMLACVLITAVTAFTGAGGPVLSATPPRAPDFHLPLLNGGTISLADFKGRPLVLLFWTPW